MRYLVMMGSVVALLCGGTAWGQPRFGVVYAPQSSMPETVVDPRLYAVTPSGDVVYAKRLYNSPQQEVWIGSMDRPASAVWAGSAAITSLAGNGSGAVAFSTAVAFGQDRYESTARVISGGQSRVLMASDRNNDLRVGPMTGGSRIALYQSGGTLHAFDASDAAYRGGVDTRDFESAFGLFPQSPRVLSDGSVRVWGGGGFETRFWDWDPDGGGSGIVYETTPADRDFVTVHSVSTAVNGLSAVVARMGDPSAARAIFVVSDGLAEPLHLEYAGTVLTSIWDASINSAGQVLFAAQHEQRTGLYLYETGNVTLLTEVSGPLLGSTVMSIGLGPNALNDAGDFAFWGALTDRRWGFFGGVIPAPGTAVVLLAMCPIGACRRVRRR